MMYEMFLDMDLLNYLKLNKTTEKTPLVENGMIPHQHTGVFLLNF